MTNLGGSAATIELAAVENTAFALLPILTAARGRGRLSRKDITALQVGPECLASATQRLDEAKEGRIAGADTLGALIREAQMPDEPVEQGRMLQSRTWRECS